MFNSLLQTPTAQSKRRLFGELEPVQSVRRIALTLKRLNDMSAAESKYRCKLTLQTPGGGQMVHVRCRMYFPPTQRREVRILIRNKTLWSHIIRYLSSNTTITQPTTGL